ncbi:unnamed protein product [Ixodes hexagonus]
MSNLLFLLLTHCPIYTFFSHIAAENDSINTFKEILEIAVKNEVDFILLGGDMFHENKPPRWVEHETLKLLRQHCLGDKPVRFEMLSDQSENFGFCAFPNVNYEDANLNVSYPVFTVHGNHDDPTGSENLSIVDVLATSGLVNYFGKVTNMTDVRLSPLLLRKGRTLLALYGLGWIRDERLHRLFRDGKVKMLRPREQTEDWFNLMVLHQNRAKHGATDYIPETFLDDFLDLVVWGHEHECRIEPEWNGRFHVTQPGSSVATSLCPGEAVPKHVGILEIRFDGKEKRHKMTKVPLMTVRPYYIKDISLYDLTDTSSRRVVTDLFKAELDFCAEHVEEFLEKAAYEHSGDPRQPKAPLIRLRVEHGDEHETFSSHLLARMFMDRVANPRDIVLFTKRRTGHTSNGAGVDLEHLREITHEDALATSRVEDLVREYFETVEGSLQMTVLTDVGMQQAMNLFVEKDCTDSITEAVKMQEVRATDRLAALGDALTEDKLEETLFRLKDQFADRAEAEAMEIRRRIETGVASQRGRVPSAVGDDSEDEIDEDMEEQTTARKKRGRGGAAGRRGRGARGAASSSARARGRQKRGLNL